MNLTRIVSGTQLSPRHPRYLRRDEFIYVVAGEVVLQTEAGEEEVLRTGMCAGFPAGMRDGYAFLNRSENDVLLLVVGDRTATPAPNWRAAAHRKPAGAGHTPPFCGRKRHPAGVTGRAFPASLAACSG